MSKNVVVRGCFAMVASLSGGSVGLEGVLDSKRVLEFVPETCFEQEYDSLVYSLTILRKTTSEPIVAAAIGPHTYIYATSVVCLHGLFVTLRLHQSLALSSGHSGDD
jgi:hypothetical protein